MSFINSLINQLGRDSGKVITNMVFKDSHATPVRVTGGNRTILKQLIKKVEKSEFEKLINFNMSFTPKTLARKTIALFSALDGEMNKMFSDNYIDNDEMSEITAMHIDFLNKCIEVLQALSLSSDNQESNETVLNAAKLANQKMTRILVGTNSYIESMVTQINSDIEENKPIGFDLFKNNLTSLQKLSKNSRYRKYCDEKNNIIADLESEIKYYHNRSEAINIFINRLSKINFENV